MESNIIAECQSCLAYQKPDPIQNFEDQFNSQQKIEPYLPFFGGQTDGAKIPFKQIESLISLRDMTGLEHFFADLVPGKKFSIHLRKQGAKAEFYAFSEQLRYQYPQVSITTLTDGQQSFEVLDRPFLPRACPKDERRMGYLRCTVDARELRCQTSVFVEQLTEALPKWQILSPTDVLYAEIELSGPGMLFYLYFPASANVYPCALLQAAAQLNCAIGDFTYTEVTDLARNYGVTFSVVRHKSLLAVIDENASHFEAYYARMRPVDDISFSVENIALCVLTRDFKNATLRLAVSSYEALAKQKVNLDVLAAFRFVANAIKTKHARFGLSGRIVAEVACVADKASVDILERTDQMLYFKILKKAIGDYLNALALEGVHVLMNKYVDALHDRKISPYVLENGEMRPASENDAPEQIIIPFIGSKYFETFQKQIKDDAIQLQLEIMKKNMVDPHQVTINQLLQPARFVRPFFHLKHLRYACYRGKTSDPVFSKLQNVEWRGQGSDKTIFVSFQADFGSHLTDNDVCSSLLKMPVQKSIFEQLW